MRASCSVLIVAIAMTATAPAYAARAIQSVPLKAGLLGPDASDAVFHGRQAVKLTEPGNGKLVLLPVSLAGDGAIEVMIAGAPRPGSDQNVRGFFGVAFGAGDDPERYEAFYVRATNGRTSDPERRAHAVQYISMPEHTWQKLRAGSPGVYEKPADIAPDEWQRLRIELAGPKARVYVGKSMEPALVVDRIINSGTKGRIGLWVGTSTDAYFADLRVTR